jgi:nucleoid DNA-binding protein
MGMKRLEDAAKEAGIHRIECPHCGRRFNTSDLFRRLFAGVISLIQKGERVNVPRFGIFHSVKYGAKNHTSPVIRGGVVVGEKLVLKFKQAAAARRLLNPPGAAAVARGHRAAAHKKQQQVKQDEALKRMHEREAKAKAGKKKAKKKAKR